MIRNAFIARAIGALSLVFSGTFLGAVFNFIAQLTLARSMEINDLGTLAALTSVINFLALVGIGGMNWFLLQVHGKEGDQSFRWYFPAAQLIAFLTFLGIVGLVGYGFTIGNFNAAERVALLALAVPMLFGQLAVELSSIRYQMERRDSQVAVWQVVTQLGRAVVAIGLKIFASCGFWSVLAGFGFMGVMAVFWSLIAVPRRSWLRLSESRRHDHPTMVQTGHEAAPFLLLGALYLMFFQGPIVILELIRGGADTAQYNIAFLIVSATMMFPSVFYSKFIAARVFRWGHHDRAKFAASFYLSAALMAAAGFAIMAVLVVSAGWLIPWVFGWRYVPAVDLLLVMSAAIPLRFLQSAYSSLLVTRPQTISRVIYLGITALISVAASCMLIPSLGALGAAYVTVLAELVLFLLSWWGLSQYLPEIRPFGWLQAAIVRQSIADLSNKAP